MVFKAIKNPKNRTLVLVVGVILLAGVIVAVLNIGKGDKAINKAKSKLSSIPRGVDYTPGGKATAKYSKLLEKENLKRAEEASKKGENFVATIGGRVSEKSLGLSEEAEADLRRTILLKYPELKELLDRYPDLYSLLTKHPELSSLFAKECKLLGVSDKNILANNNLDQTAAQNASLKALLEKYPGLAELIAKDPSLIDRLLKDPSLAERLLKAASTGSKYSDDPVLAEIIRKNPGLDKLLEQYPNLAELLRNNPELAEVLLNNPELAALLSENPELLAAVMQDPELAMKLSRDKNLSDALRKNPSLVKQILQYPELIDMIRKHPELAALLRKNPGLAKLLVDNPKLAAILAKNPEIAGRLLRDRNYAQYLDSGEVPISLQDNIRSTLAEQKVKNTRQAQIDAEQKAALNEAKLKALQQVVTAMEKQANSAIKSWAAVNPQKYTAGAYAAAALEEQKILGEKDKNGNLINKNNNKSDLDKDPEEAEIILKAGKILFAVLETAVNSDEIGPIMAKIVTGPLKGSRVLGKIKPPTKDQEKLILSFDKLNIPEAPFTIALNAVAIDPDTARTGIADDIDHHYLYRYGSLFAAKFMEGYSKAVAESGTTNTQLNQTSGSVTTTDKGTLSGRQQFFQGLGEVGKAWGSAVGDNFNRKPTISINQGTGIGLLVLADIKSGIPIKEDQVTATLQQQSSTESGGEQ